MVSNRTRSRYKKRRRKLDSEMSFINILGDVFSNEVDQISQNVAESISDDESSVPGLADFVKRQQVLDDAD